MQSRIRTGYRIMRSGGLLLLLPMLMALAACTNPTPSAAASASSGAVRVAGDNTGNTEPHSVDAVSDALGQRLDGMLNARQTGTNANR
jgi:hypothetical protein